MLLDAGAGTSWSYKSKQNARVYRRSEGLAIASLEMFKAGIFSSNPDQPHQVDGGALRRLSLHTMATGLQVTEANPIAGLEGRTGLLTRLGSALSNQQLFGVDSRPGNMLGMYIMGDSYLQAANKSTRLFDFASLHTSFFRTNRPTSDSLVRPH